MIESLQHFFHFLFNVQGLIEWGGTLLVCVIVFIETGFFVGFFLPGDSLLVTAGVFAAAGNLNLEKLFLLVPLFGPFCPPVAGAAMMPYGRYVTYDIAGGILWVGSMILGGYFLGLRIPNIGENIHYVIAAVIVLSLFPPVISVLRARFSGAAKSSAVVPPTPSERK